MRLSSSPGATGGFRRAGLSTPLIEADTGIGPTSWSRIKDSMRCERIPGVVYSQIRSARRTCFTLAKVLR
jgi:hypothetical protein